jgi:diguanylate cyclase (GGDEF)-like protein/PAS domain S-box-containing protein
MDIEVKSLDILVIEDSEDDCRLLVRELKRGGITLSFLRVDTPEALKEALAAKKWDIVFSDYSMPYFTGLEALAIIREKDPVLPFIFVSGTIGEDTAVLAMKNGAQDYVMKANVKRLLPAVKRELMEAEEKRAHLRSEEERRKFEKRYQNILTMASDAIISVNPEEQIVLFNRGAQEIFGYTSEEAMGLPLDSLLPKHFPLLHKAHPVPDGGEMDLSRNLPDRTDILGHRKDGSEFPAEASVSVLTENGTSTYTVILRDITERKRAESSLRLLQEITCAVSEAGDVNEALSLTLRKVCDATGWIFGQAWFPNPAGTTIECSPARFIREGDGEPFCQISRERVFFQGEGLPGQVLSSGKPLWIPEIDEADSFPRKVAARNMGFRSAVGIPVLSGSEVVAVLEFFSREPKQEDEQMVEVITTVGAQVGTAILRKRSEERLHFFSHHHSLTHLPNRLLFHERLEEAMQEARSAGKKVGVLLLDIDRFKTVNDSLGYETGDDLLKSIAKRLSETMRSGDTVAHLSGDEFALVVPNMEKKEDILLVVRKVQNCFAKPFALGSQELFCSISLGVTLFPDDEQTAESLIRNADIAMYQSKGAGGDTFRVYSPEMKARAKGLLALGNELRRGIERNEFVLHYQPFVDLSKGWIIGMEALVRWNHPDKGLVYPCDFISYSEETGLIVPLGNNIFRMALTEWSRMTPPFLLSVNVSPRQFHQFDLYRTFSSIIEETGFDPGCLEIEITESLLMEHLDTSLETMNKLHQKGIRFSVDDFGTGYSNLSYLKQFPINRLKIDRSFVIGVPGNENDVALTRAIVSLAKSLGLEIIAEGIETPEQRDFLKEAGCQFGQGYYFSRPKPAEEIRDLLSKDFRFDVLRSS